MQASQEIAHVWMQVSEVFFFLVEQSKPSSLVPFDLAKRERKTRIRKREV